MRNEPFPLPILDDIGFAVIGKKGKIRIQIFPFFFIFLDIACLAASICLAVIIAEFLAFNLLFQILICLI
jgi:hypothetical protein